MSFFFLVPIFTPSTPVFTGLNISAVFLRRNSFHFIHSFSLHLFLPLTPSCNQRLFFPIVILAFVPKPIDASDFFVYTTCDVTSIFDGISFYYYT